MNKQRSFGVILQYTQMALQIVINLIYTPVMLRILGDSEYGIYNLASSIIAYLNLLSLGFGASYIRFYSRYKADNDEEGVKKLNGLYLLVFLAIGVISLIAGLIIANNVGIFFNETYTEKDLHIAHILMIFLSVNLAISFPASVFVSYITSQERFIFQKIVNMGKTVLSPCLNIAVLFLGYGSIGMVIVTTCISLLVDVINVSFCVGKLKMRFSFKNPNFKLLREIASFSIFIAINQIIDQINWQTDKVILGKMVNASAVAIYAVASSINAMYISFSTAISSVFAPKIHKIVNSGEPDTDKKLTNLFIKVGRIQFYVIMLVLTGFIFFGQFFIIKWAGDGYELSYYIALLLICPAAISLIQNMGIEIQRAKNKHQFRSIAYLIMAFFNVGISILFCYLFGTIGVAVGTTFAIVFANGLIMNIYYQKKLGIDVIRFWKEILKIIPSMLPAITLGVLLMIFYTFTGYVDYFLFILLYVVVYCIFVFLFGTNKAEKNMIKKLLQKVLKKR